MQHISTHGACLWNAMQLYKSIKSQTECLEGLKWCGLKSNSTEVDAWRLHCKSAGVLRCGVKWRIFTHKSPLVVVVVLLQSHTSFIRCWTGSRIMARHSSVSTRAWGSHCTELGLCRNAMKILKRWHRWGEEQEPCTYLYLSSCHHDVIGTIFWPFSKFSTLYFLYGFKHISRGHMANFNTCSL